MRKDNRKTFSHHHLITETGLAFQFDGKFDPATGKLKVYRVFGNINRIEEIKDRLQTFCEELACA